MARPFGPVLLGALLGGLSGNAAGLQGQRPIPVLVVGGANNHDCEWTTPELKNLLVSTGRFAVDVTTDPAHTLADAALLAHYRAVVLDYNGPRWGEPAESTFLAAVQGGTGVAVVHAANNAFPGWEEYERMVGDLWREGTGHGKFHAFDVRIVDASHPVTAGMAPLHAHPDELYHGLVRTPGTAYRVLAVANSSRESGGTGQDEPMILVGQYGAGRVFHTPLGHVWRGSEESRQSYRDPQFRELVARGVEWAATGEIAPAAPWITLFDGTSTAAWRGYGHDSFPEHGWRVTDGALVCEEGGQGGDLVTRQEWDDLVLEFEWRVTPRANSGVMVRVVEGDGPTWTTGPEYQVIDNAYFENGVDPLHAAGALYDIDPARDAPLAEPGAWNRGRIVVCASRITHFLDDVLVAECDFATDEGRARVAASKFASLPFLKSSRGRIALQDHGDEVAYRNVRLRPLGPAPRALLGPGFQGWTWVGDGATREEVWREGESGSVVCRGTPPGYLRTEADALNYVLELDWRWVPGAEGRRNSGVLLRMNGEDHVWPRCLEAQLESGNAGDFWILEGFACHADPERTSGTNVHRLAAAESAVGEWNHYQIAVTDSVVRLEINGVLVNEATEVERVSGKICLQSEGAEIEFRDVRLTPLP